MPSHIYLPVPTPGLQKIALDLQSKMNDLAAGSCGAALRNASDKGRMKGIRRAFGGGCLRGVGNDDVLYVVIHGTGAIGMERVGADRNTASEGVERPDNLMRPLGAPDLVDNNPSVWKTYTAESLAKNLKDEGLPVGHKLIELLACGAGLSDDEDHRARELEVNVSKNQIAQNFAGNLKTAKGGMAAKVKAAVDERVAAAEARAKKPHLKMDQSPNLSRSFGDRFHTALQTLGYSHVTVHAYKGNVKAGLNHAAPGAAAAAFTIESMYKTGQMSTFNPNEDGMREIYPRPLPH